MRTPPRVNRGYALILFMAIIAMTALYAIVSRLDPATQAAERATATAVALKEAKDALIAYAATYRDNNSSEVFGYLPCPDMTTTASGAQGNGAAESTCGNAGETAVGLLPYKTLGLEQLRDEAGICLWYAVSGNYKNSPKTAPINWDTQGQIAIVDASGATIATPGDGSGGAAAVIIAAGIPVSGQSRTSTTGNNCGVVPAEIAQYLDGNYTFTTSSTVTLAQGPVRDSSGSIVTNNDRMIWVSPKDIFDKVIARADFSNASTSSPAGQINALGNKMKVALEKLLQADLLAGTAPSTSLPTNITTVGGKFVGTMPTALSLTDSSYTSYLSNWNSQYRLVTCSSLSTACLTIGNSTCRAGLFFAGRGGSFSGSVFTAKPRATNSTLSDYFEASSATYYPGAYDLLTNSGTSSFPSGGASSFSSTTPSADVGVCLLPGSFVSFAQNINSFSSGQSYGGSGSGLISVNTGSQSVTLGNSGGSGGSACAWYPSAFPMASSLRLYFKLNVASKGDGFTVALADGATNAGTSMCGASGSTTLGYAGTPIGGGATTYINKPKLGLEFDTKFDSTRSDPHGDHIAFVYWGNTSDSDASNDNTHYLGLSGYQVISGTVTPEDLVVTNASWSNGFVTVTTQIPHGLAAGSLVKEISGITPTGYSGNGITVLSTPSTTKFTYAVTNSLDTYVAGGSVKLIRATLNTASYNSYAVADGVIVSGTNPSILDGVYAIATTPSTTQLSYTVASDPGTFVSGGQVKAVTTGAAPINPRIATAMTDTSSNAISISSASAGYQSTGSCAGQYRVTAFTSANHEMKAGQTVYVTGVTPRSYSGTYTLTSGSSTTFPNRFRYCLTSNPGSYTSGGTAVAGNEISALSWSSGSATAIFTSSLTLPSGTNSTYRSLAGITPPGYMTSATLNKNSATNFYYSLGSDPGGTFSTESPKGMMVVQSSTSAPYSYLNYSSLPTSTNIHVRLDISRSYDSTNHVALLNLKAYVGDTFGSAPDTCSSSDFQDLTEDLADLCPYRTVTLQQDSIPVSALVAPSNIASIAWSSGTQLVTVTTATAHGLINGASVTLSGITPSAYNGTYTITVMDSTHFTYSLTSDPGSYVSGGDVQPLSTVYFGFTTARSTSNSAEDQSATISGLILRSQ